MESHTKWLRKHVKIGKMIRMTVEMSDGYQRFIILFSLGICLKMSITEGYKSFKTKQQQQSVNVSARGVCSLLMWVPKQFNDCVSVQMCAFTTVGTDCASCSVHAFGNSA